MTDKPTPEQIQRACDLVNSESRAAGDGSIWNPLDFDVFPSLKVLADTIAKLDALQPKEIAVVEVTQEDISAALSHIGFDSVEDLHYWAKDNNELNRFDALTQVLAAHRQAGVQQGLDMAAAYIQTEYPFDKRKLVPAIRKLGGDDA